MSSLAQFTDGTVGSASQVATAFTTLRTQGQSSINELVVLRQNTLLLFSNALEALSGRQVRANRLPQVGISTRFVVSDLLDINQVSTTATLRAQANSVSLKERASPGEATVSTVVFTASEGTIQALQVPTTGTSGDLGALYRVATTNGFTPTGTFTISLLAPVNASLILFDMIDMPSSPTITVSISQNGITFTPATSISQNGSSIGAWFAPADTQFIQITIVPALPDVLGGSVFTFGLTDFHAFTIQYHLLSNLYTNQIEITPVGAQVQFSAPATPNIIYFLSIGDNPSIEVNPGDLITIPGSTVVTNQNVDLLSGGQLNFTLPTDVYLPSFTITDAATGLPMRIAPGLPITSTGMTNQYITLDGSGNMYLVVYTVADAARTFNLTFATGPISIDVSLQVQLSTNDLNTTPLYTGAELIEV